MKFQKVLLIVIILLAGFLRFNQLAQIPHGLYIDEISIGNNAYSILHEGRDEYSTQFPLFFKAFGEYKMPVAIYMTSAAMEIFGKTEFAVRFPSALFGTCMIFVLYLFVKELFGKRGQKLSKNTLESIALLTVFFAAISPVTIQFSRGGFEANIALFFYLLGGWLFLRYITSQKMWYLFASLSSFVLTMYTYNAYRLIAPLTLLLCFFYLFRTAKKKIHKPIILGSVFVVVLLIPLLIFSFSSEGAHRFMETSAFEQKNLNLLQQIGLYPMIYLQNYLSYFSLPFLFLSGDGFGRHTVTDMGNLFRWQLPFILVGAFFLLKNRKSLSAQVLLFLLFVSPITASFTRPSPHTLRSLLLMIPLLILAAYGCVMTWQYKAKWMKGVFVGLSLFALFESAFYFHMYYTHYPQITALDWGAEYKQLVLEASRMQPHYDKIVVVTKLREMTAYRDFYDKDLVFYFVDDAWKRPPEWKNMKVLYVTKEYKYKIRSMDKLFRKHIKDIRFDDTNKSVFVQFWEI